jgi:hypothetical protein
MALYSPVYPNNLIDTINQILSDVGVLSNLSTNVKTSLVAAINEVNNSVSSIQNEVGSLTALNTTDKSSVIAAINEVDGIATGAASNIGTLSSLNTTDKSSLVAAINEVDSDVSSKLEQKPDGTHDLIDNSNKISVGYLPDFILGSLLYGGVFDPTTAVATLTTNAKTKLGTSSNTITLTNDTTPITGYEANEGIFYICSGPGTFASISFSNGDWLISTGTGWNRVDTSDAVTSVEGRTGSVTVIDDSKGSGDTTYTWSADKLSSILSAGVVSDVKINNISVVTSGVANIPYASTNNGGVIKLSPSYYGTDIGTGVQEGRLTSVVYSYAGYAGISNLAFVSKGTLENILAGKEILTGVPSQSGQSGKFLTTDGTDVSWASVSGGTSSLSDIAVAGDNVTFTTPSNTDYVSSSDKINSATISSTGIFAPTGSQYIQFTSSSIPNYTGSIFTGNYDWSWTFKFKSPSDVTEEHSIFKAGSSLTNFNIWCALSESNSINKRLNVGVHLSDDSWSNGLYQGGVTDLTPNTWYWVRLSRTISSNTYKLELSTDGTNWTTEISFTSSLGLYNTYATFYLANSYGSAAGTDEYDMTGCKFTTSYSYVNDYVAYIVDDRTTISAAGLPSQSGQSGKFLTTNGTAASWSSALTNTATGTNNALALFGTATGSKDIAIGDGSQTSGGNGVAVGASAKATYGSSTAVGSSAQATASAANAFGTSAQATNAGATALGYAAKATAAYAIQLGYGTNSTANTLSVGLSSSNNYRLLDSDGTIPGGRVPRSVYDRVESISSGTIALDDGTVFYTDAPTVATTYTIDSSALTVSGLNYRYFNVLIEMPATAVGIDFTTNNTIVWAEGSTPDMSIGGRTYLLAFQTFDGGTTWIGSLCTWWTTPTP